MFQLHKDIFTLTSTPNIAMAENWQEDIANHLRDLVRVNNQDNRYIVWYRSNDTPGFIFIIAPVEDRHYIYVKDKLNNETGKGLREVLEAEGDLSKYFLCATTRTPEEWEGVTFHGVALDVTDRATNDLIRDFIGSAADELIRHRDGLAEGQNAVLFLTGKFTEDDINDLEQSGFELGNLLYKF